MRHASRLAPLAALALTVQLVSASLADARRQTPDAPTQSPPQSPPTQQSPQPLATPRGETPVVRAPVEVGEDEVVRITTNLVQLDVVVTDAKGNQVTDLKSEDFEVLQDGRAQQITNFSYVSTVAPGTPTAREAARLPRPDKREIGPPPQAPRRERVRRTLVFFVDDLNMSFPGIVRARDAISKIIDEQLQPGDLMAIIRTGSQAGMLQQLTGDRRLLHAAADQIRWSFCSTRGLYEQGPVMQSGSSALAPDTHFSLGEPLQGCGYDVRSTTLGTLNFVVEGMRDLPGRKSVVIISENMPLTASDPGTGALAPSFNDDAPNKATTNLSDIFYKIAQKAARGSVVIYGINTRGLQSFTPSAADDISRLSPQQISSIVDTRMDEAFFGDQGPAYLTSQTGGFYVHNANDVTRAMRRIADDLRGYYLIGYRPEGSTFNRRFHKITARVKGRPDLTVRTRSGFYGLTEEEERPASTPADNLARALVSPFASGQIGLRLTPLVSYAPPAGTIVRTLLHIDARDLAFKDQPDGWRAADMVVRCVLFGDNGRIVEEHDRSFTVRLRGKTFERALAAGLNYTFNMPVKKTGFYQYHVALLDPSSSHVGSAGQPVEIPDIKGARLAVSGIVMRGVPDQPQTRVVTAGAARTPDADAAQPAEGADLSELAETTPYVRRFRQGSAVDYSYIIFNARPSKQTGATAAAVRTRLFRDGELVSSSDSSVEVPQLAGPTRVVNGGRLSFGDRLAPGDYALQVIVTDPLADARHRTATQWIDFQIVK